MQSMCSALVLIASIGFHIVLYLAYLIYINKQVKFYSLPGRYNNIRPFKQRPFIGNWCSVLIANQYNAQEWPLLKPDCKVCQAQLRTKEHEGDAPCAQQTLQSGAQILLYFWPFEVVSKRLLLVDTDIP